MACGSARCSSRGLAGSGGSRRPRGGRGRRPPRRERHRRRGDRCAAVRAPAPAPGPAGRPRARPDRQRRSPRVGRDLPRVLDRDPDPARPVTSRSATTAIRRGVPRPVLRGRRRGDRGGDARRAGRGGHGHRPGRARRRRAARRADARAACAPPRPAIGMGRRERRRPGGPPLDRLVDRAMTLAGAWEARPGSRRRSARNGRSCACSASAGSTVPGGRSPAKSSTATSPVARGAGRRGRPAVRGGPARVRHVAPAARMEVAAGTIDLGLEAEVLRDAGRHASAEAEVSG